MYHIYKITNNINGKVYIGQTRVNPPEKRILSHFKKKSKKFQYALHRAIEKHDKNNFSYEVICGCYTKEDCNYLEVFFIKNYNTLVPNGYNIEFGGTSDFEVSETRKMNISKANKEYYKTHNNPFKGKKFSKEHCEALSKVRKGFTSPARKEARKRSVELSKLPVKATNIITNEVRLYDSIAEAAVDTKAGSYNISRVCNKKQGRTQSKGWKFEFFTKETVDKGKEIGYHSNMNLDSIKQFLDDANKKGIKIPMLRDPKTDTASVSLTMLFISFNVVLLGLIGKFAGFLGGINLEQAIYFFMVCSGLYFARSVSSGKNGTKIEEESKENNNE